MRFDRLNKWLTLGANIAVLAGIVILVVEIRQNTEMTRAQITQSRAEAALILSEALFNSPYMPEILEKTRNDEELSYQEDIRYRAWLRSLLRNMDNNYQQMQSGLLDEHVINSTSDPIRSVIVRDKSARRFWEASKHNFSAEFSSFVDSVIVESEEQQ